MNNELPQEAIMHKPGDVVNGHVLSSEGRWIPVGAPFGAGAGAAPRHGQSVPPQSPVWSHPVPQTVYVQADNSNNTSLAPVTSLISGIIGLLFCWIPILGIVGWVFGPLALLFGILGLQRGKAEHKVMSYIGIVLGSITVVVCVAYLLFFIVAIGTS